MSSMDTTKNNNESSSTTASQVIITSQLISHKESGNAAFKKGQYKTAIEHYNRALSNAPHPLPTSSQTQKPRHHHSSSSSSSSSNKTKKKNDDDDVNHIIATIASNKAECLLKLELWNDAKSACDVSLSYHPTMWKSLWRRGKALENLQSFTDARHNYHEALALCHDVKSRTAINDRLRRIPHDDNSPPPPPPPRAPSSSSPPAARAATDNDDIIITSTCANRILSTDRNGHDCIDQLMTKGYAILDDYFDRTHAMSLLSEVKNLIHLKEPTSFLAPNRTYFKDGKGVITHFDKPHVFEVDLFALFGNNNRTTATAAAAATTGVEEMFPLLKGLYHDNAIPSAFDEGGKGEIAIDKNEGQRAIKLQWNEGGGSFPWHVDNPGSNRRRITTVVYLNDEWKPGDGGEIVLLPFMETEEVKIAPTFNRAVIFLSEVMNHKVLPAVKERYCFSIWYYRHPDSPTNFDLLFESRLEALPMTPLPSHLVFLRKPSVQRTLARLVYEEEYLDSLALCMMDDDNTTTSNDDNDNNPPNRKEIYDNLLRMHRQHVDGIRKANAHTGLLDVIEMLREVKLSRKERVVL